MNSLPKILNIAVVRGGNSPEYEISLKTGAKVLNTLSETHRPFDVFISKDGKWHIGGIERSPERILKGVDVVFNALHGNNGENIKLQEILDYHNIPYTGSDRLSSAVSQNKILTKEKIKQVGIKTPIFFTVSNQENISNKAGEIHRSIPYPLIVKPVYGGSSLGISVVRNPKELVDSIEKAFSFGEKVLVEEYISGKEVSCGVINNIRNSSLYSLPPIEVINKKNKDFFDYESKYNKDENFKFPANLYSEEKRELERLAILAHKSLGLRHYSKSDFIISPRRGIYFIETNSLPSMTDNCLFPKSLEAVGIKFKDFIHHVLCMALG